MRCAMRSASSGSSPRVRGTRSARPGCTDDLRFIPACAGNSLASATLSTARTVHPRVCGELISLRYSTKLKRGSSPRVRGTRDIYNCKPALVRFIPACAGNSSRLSGIHHPRAVHPRVCGELVRVIVPLSGNVGSSPRVRGTPDQRSRRGAPVRFIPACAGNSLVSSAPVYWAPVHPRVCGELRAAATATEAYHGSSPRVRGTHLPEAA